MSDEAPTLWWCKRRDGRIVEHRATAYEGHREHVLCIEVPPPLQDKEPTDD